MAISKEKLDEIRQSGFRPGIVGCFIYNKRVLMVYSHEFRLWQLPQGGIDNNETIREAIVRELTEELGEFVTKQCEEEYTLFGENKVEFPKKNHGNRPLQTDGGEELMMKGKKYFFIKIDAKNPDIRLKKTEFDDYYWLNYKDAKKFSATIYQRGKQRITNFALDRLHAKGYLI